MILPLENINPYCAKVSKKSKFHMQLKKSSAKIGSRLMLRFVTQFIVGLFGNVCCNLLNLDFLDLWDDDYTVVIIKRPVVETH